MDVREKLVELLCNLPTPEFVIGTRRAGKKLITAGFIADHLIANGVTVQENVKMSDELLKQLKNAPITICKEEPSIVTVQEWISVNERLPDEHETLFARYKGTDKWLNGMFMTTSDLVIVCVECENGERIVKTAITKEGVWKIKDSFHQYRVTHWMPLPEPPEVGRND